MSYIILYIIFLETLIRPCSDKCIVYLIQLHIVHNILILYITIPRTLTHRCSDKCIIKMHITNANAHFHTQHIIYNICLHFSTARRVTKLCIQGAVDCNQLYLDHWTNVSINQWSIQVFLIFKWTGSICLNDWHTKGNRNIPVLWITFEKDHSASSFSLV